MCPGVNAGGDAPCGVDGYPDALGAVELHQPFNLLLVFAAVECAGAVYHPPSGAQRGPQVVGNLALQGGAVAHQSLAPLRHGLRVLAHHPLARAGHIGHDDVKLLAQGAEARGVAAGHDDRRIAPAHDVLAQGGGACGHIFVGHGHRPGGEGRHHGSGLPPGSGTGVEHPQGMADTRGECPHNMCMEHRGGLLDIICPGMEPRVESELRTRGQI